jgi:hypothetical protein
LKNMRWFGPIKNIIMSAPVLAAALTLTGCAPARPATESSAVRSPPLSVPADETSCQRAGGQMERVGRLQTLQCVVSYADAGKSCTSGDQCAGDCRASQGIDVAPGQPVAGYCQANSNRFGCSTKVENGRAQSTICID